MEVLIEDLEKKLGIGKRANVYERVDYYCKTSAFEVSKQTKIKDLKKAKTPKAYYFDTYEYARFFDSENFIDYVFGMLPMFPVYQVL